MKLIAIELGGFKSFAKSTTVIVDSGLTAIIGPNGSGKSNLAEAMRWVLGEQSLKQLRSQSREDILFAGAAGLHRAARAYVRLSLDNEDGRFPIESAEISLARTVTSSGDSEYTLNGEPVRLSNLRRMLAEAGIGARTYTVISQSMVDRYLTASPAERKTFFDEAAGIQGLVIRLQETTRRLAQASTHVAELTAILRELEPRLRHLKREAQKQAERERLATEYNTRQAVWFHQAWYTRQHELEMQRSQVNQLESEVAVARRERQAAEEDLIGEIRTTTVPAVAASWNVRVRRVLKECLFLIDSLLHRHGISEERLTALQSEIEHLLMPSVTGTTALRPDQLAAARETELAAERELAAARVGLEAAEEAAAMLRHEAVRERGSAFLHQIEITRPAPGDSVSEQDIARLTAALARLGEADPLTLREHQETEQRHKTLLTHIRDNEEIIDRLQRAAAKLELAAQERFERQFIILQQAFAQYFTRLFQGGQARLTQTESGIEITAQPPGKHPRHVQLLSGGERTLTSLALLLAIVEAQAPPFVVLDEVDAALDEANSERFAALLQEKSRETQYLVITHNRETMARADILYGVTMAQAGISSLYSVRFQELQA